MRLVFGVSKNGFDQVENMAQVSDLTLKSSEPVLKHLDVSIVGNLCNTFGCRYGYHPSSFRPPSGGGLVDSFEYGSANPYENRQFESYQNIHPSSGSVPPARQVPPVRPRRDGFKCFDNLRQVASGGIPRIDEGELTLTHITTHQAGRKGLLAVCLPASNLGRFAERAFLVGHSSSYRSRQHADQLDTGQGEKVADPLLEIMVVKIDMVRIGTSRIVHVWPLNKEIGFAIYGRIARNTTGWQFHQIHCSLLSARRRSGRAGVDRFQRFSSVIHSIPTANLNGAVGWDTPLLHEFSQRRRIVPNVPNVTSKHKGNTPITVNPVDLPGLFPLTIVNSTNRELPQCGASQLHQTGLLAALRFKLQDCADKRSNFLFHRSPSSGARPGLVGFQNAINCLSGVSILRIETTAEKPFQYLRIIEGHIKVYDGVSLTHSLTAFQLCQKHLQNLFNLHRSSSGGPPACNEAGRKAGGLSGFRFGRFWTLRKGRNLPITVPAPIRIDAILNGVQNHNVSAVRTLFSDHCLTLLKFFKFTLQANPFSLFVRFDTYLIPQNRPSCLLTRKLIGWRYFAKRNKRWPVEKPNNFNRLSATGQRKGIADLKLSEHYSFLCQYPNDLNPKWPVQDFTSIEAPNSIIPFGVGQQQGVNGRVEPCDRQTSRQLYQIHLSTSQNGPRWPERNPGHQEGRLGFDRLSEFIQNIDQLSRCVNEQKAPIAIVTSHQIGCYRLLCVPVNHANTMATTMGTRYGFFLGVHRVITRMLFLETRKSLAVRSIRNSNPGVMPVRQS